MIRFAHIDPSRGHQQLVIIDAVVLDHLRLDAVDAKAAAQVQPDRAGVGRHHAKPDQAQTKLARLGHARLDQRLGHAQVRANLAAYRR